MPGTQLTATRGSETRTFDASDASLLRAAVEKGWTVDGHTVVRREDSYRAVPSDRDDLLEAATSKGWALVGGSPVAPFEGWVAPPAMAPTDGSFGEAALAASAPVLEQRTDAAAQQKFARELAAQRTEEARRAQLEQQYGAGLSAQGLGNAAATAGEGVSRGLALGFDAPAAYIQAGVEQLLESKRLGGPANPDVPRDFGASLQAAREGIAGHQEANPLLAAGSELTGAAGPAILSGGESLAARVAAKTPAGLVARKAAQYGVGATSRIALTAPGLKGSLLRVAAPAVRLGIEGGVQGAAQGAGAEANRLWADEDTHSVAEYLSAMGGGAASGFGLGSVVGLGIGAGLGSKALAGGPEKYEQLAKGMGLIRATEPAAEAAAGVAAPAAYPEPPKPGLMRKLAGKVVKLTPEQVSAARNKAYGPIRDKWNEFLRLGQRFDEELDIAAKKNFVRTAAPEPSTFRFEDVVDDPVLGLSKGDLEALADQGAVLHDGKGGAAAVHRLVSRIESLKDDLFELSVSKQRPNGLTQGDVFIATDQAKRDVDKLVAWANSRNPYLYEALAPKADQLRGLLVDESMWPRALTQAQASTNGTWAPAISAKMDTSLNNMSGKLGVKSEYNPYDLTDKINDKWLGSHLASIGQATEEQTADAVQRLLNTAADDAVNRAGVYGSKDAQEAAARMSKLRNEIQAELGAAGQFNAAASGSPAGIGITGYAQEAALNRVREFAHKSTVDASKRVERAATLPTLLGKKPSAVAAGATKAAGQRDKIAAGVERFYDQVASGEADEDNARYVATLEQAFGPEMANAERARFSRQQQFLMQKSGDPKDPRFKTQFRKYAEPALHPLEAIDRVAAGEATTEDRETLAALHPKLLADFTRRALEAVSKASPTYHQRLRISQALGVPLDASLDPVRYQMHQEIAAQQAGQAAQAREAQQQQQVLTPGNRTQPEVNELVTP